MKPIETWAERNGIVLTSDGDYPIPLGRFIPLTETFKTCYSISYRVASKKNGLSRRNVLRMVGSTVVAVGVTGPAGASRQVEVSVGFSSERGRRVALQKATETVREFESVDALTARMSAEAARGLRDNPGVRYVEENGTVHARTPPGASSAGPPTVTPSPKST
jgi:hypothetical protein